MAATPACSDPPTGGPGFGPSLARADGLSGHAPAVVRDPDPAYRALPWIARMCSRATRMNGTGRRAPSRNAATRLLNDESPDFIRFINPSDYRVDRQACGACHLAEIQQTERSLMATGAMLWGGAAYNNGILPVKHYLLGEAYTERGRGRPDLQPGQAGRRHDPPRRAALPQCRCRAGK